MEVDSHSFQVVTVIFVSERFVRIVVIQSFLEQVFVNWSFYLQIHLNLCVVVMIAISREIGFNEEDHQLTRTVIVVISLSFRSGFDLLLSLLVCLIRLRLLLLHGVKVLLFSLPLH